MVILKAGFSAARKDFENDRWFIFVLGISKPNFNFFLWVSILALNPTFSRIVNTNPGENS